MVWLFCLALLVGWCLWIVCWLGWSWVLLFYVDLGCGLFVLFLVVYWLFVIWFRVDVLLCCLLMVGC